MFQDLFEMADNCRRADALREDQIRYLYSKPKKGSPRVKIVIGMKEAEKARIAKGARARIIWDDKNKFLMITRKESGYKVQNHDGKRCLLQASVPPTVKLPKIRKTFTNVPVDQGQLILDFSLSEDED